MIAVGDVVKIQHRDGVSEGSVVLLSRSGVSVEIDGSIWVVPANGKATRDGRRLWIPTPEELAELERKRVRAGRVQALRESCNDLKRALTWTQDWTDEQIEQAHQGVRSMLQFCDRCRHGGP